MDTVTLENYRCFRREQTVRLAPLTLLVGENGTGKTSFLALMRALREYASSFREPDFTLEPYDLGSFNEIVHRRGSRGRQATSFTVGLSAAHPSQSDNARSDSLHAFKVAFGSHNGVPFPIDRYLKASSCWVQESMTPDRFPMVQVGTERGQWEIAAPAWHRQNAQSIGTMLDAHLSLERLFTKVASSQKRQWAETDFKPLALSPSFSAEDAKQLLRKLPSPSQAQVRVCFAGAPVRSRPRRIYEPFMAVADPAGDYVPMLLASEAAINGAGWNRLKEQLESFGEAAGLFNEIAVTRLGKGESAPFQVQIRKFGPRAKGPRRNLVDAGYGISQALPVLTELLRVDCAHRPSHFLLQQPEMHLHPRAQAALGSLFCQIAKPERQLAVETHSYYLLDRIRLDIRDQTSHLAPDDVSILYFERGARETCIHSIRIDENGNIQNAPRSYRRFFMDEVERSLNF